MDDTPAPFFSARLAPHASTRPSAPSSSTAPQRTRRALRLLPTTPSASSSTVPRPIAARRPAPLFPRRAAAGPRRRVPPSRPPAPRHPAVADCREPGPRPGPLAAHPRRRRLPLPAPAGPPPLRRLVAAGRLPRLRHGPRHRRPAEPAGLEAAGQGAAQPHQRLQLRRGPRPVRRPEHPAQEVVRHRLLLPHRAATNQRRPAGGLGPGPGTGLLFPEAETFSLDFHPIPYRGDPPAWRTTTSRSAARPAQRPDFFALEQDSRVLVLRQRQPDPGRAARRGDAVRRVLARADRRRTRSGCTSTPRWTTYPELRALNRRGIWFVTIRRRGAAIVRRLAGLPAGGLAEGGDRHAQAVPPARSATWTRGCGCPATRGRSARWRWTGLGREQPTLFLSNNSRRRRAT